jgi:hypothetical protein
MQSGETLTPGQPTAGPPTQPQTPADPAPEAQQQPAPPATQEPQAASAENAGCKFNANDTSPDTSGGAAPPTPSVNPVSWTASEYIQHHKNAGWFLLAGLAIVVVAIAVFFVTKDVMSAVVIGVAGLLFAVYGARPPQVLDYSVDGTGVHIGQKFYPYTTFRSFSVQEEDATRSILLMPAQRIGLPITIYYDPKDESEIVGVIGANLPHEMREVAAVDKFMRKIRF